MSSFSLGLDLSSMNVARFFVGGFSVLGIGVAVNGMVKPDSGVAAFGFHPSTWTASTAALNPFIPIAAGRVIGPIVSGLALLALGHDRALGICLMCGCITGFLDGYFLYKYAGSVDDSKTGAGQRADEMKKVEKARKQAIGHCVLPLMISGLGTWIYRMAEA